MTSSSSSAAATAKTIFNYNSPKRKRALSHNDNNSDNTQSDSDSRPPTPSLSSSSPLPEPIRVDIPAFTGIVDSETAEGGPGQESPRTKVAYHFQGLRLEPGESKIRKLDLLRGEAEEASHGDIEMGTGEMLAANGVRKRMKVLGTAGRSTSRKRGEGPERGFERQSEIEIPETPALAEKQFTISMGPERHGIDPFIKEKGREVRLQNDLDPVIFKGSLGRVKGAGGLARAYPSINRLSDSKSRGKKRMGTPPLQSGNGTGMAEKYNEEGEREVEIVDEERASLTWHDDEITGYKLDDPDDDGEGINGIGFKPTPAIAYARMEKRRLQMEGYRSREAREARQRRNERRRGNELSKKEREEERQRRVRFMDADPAARNQSMLSSQ